MHNRILRNPFMVLLVFISIWVITVSVDPVYSQDIIREEMPEAIEEIREDIHADLPAVIIINYDEELAPLAIRKVAKSRESWWTS
jgi:hypothetical protein